MSLTVYEIANEGPVGYLEIATKGEYDRVVEILKKRSAGPWTAPETKISFPFVPADIVGFGPNAVAFTSHATELLRDLIDRCAEMLPIHSVYGDYVWFNCTEFLDCVDKERLEGTSANYGENISLVWSGIKKWAFHEDKITGAPPVFRTTLFGHSLKCFCSDVFKSRVEAAGLVGMSFNPVWNSETGGIPQEFPALLGPEGLENGIIFEERQKELASRFGIFYPANWGSNNEDEGPILL